MKTKNICPFCKNSFAKKHGNQIYCSSECKNHQKASTQYKLYGILKEFRKGFLNNFKLFEKLVPEGGVKHFQYSQLLIDGFKENCFYGAFADEDKRVWYKVGMYHFTVNRKDQVLTVSIKK